MRTKSKTAETRIKRSLRGISPVISVLLMIAIAVAASLVAYAWVMGYLDFTTSKTGQAIIVQSSAIDTSSNDLLVYVQNVGSSTVEFSPTACVYIDNELKVCSISGDNPLDKGKTATLAIAGADTLSYPIKLKVVTISGTSTERYAWKLSSVDGIAPLETLIFYDDFESGNSDKWTQKIENGGTFTVESAADAYQGTYLAKATVGSNLDDYVSLRKTVTSTDNLYISVYMRFDSLYSAEGYVIAGPMFRNSGASSMAMSILSFDGATRKWGVRYWDSPVWKNILESGTSTVEAGKWYFVEMQVIISDTNGELHLWVDGVEKISASGLDTNDYGSINTAAISVYIDYAEGVDRPICFDYVSVSDAYIGPE